VDDELANYRQILDILDGAYGPGHRGWWPGKVRARIGQCLLTKRNYKEAETYLLEGYRMLAERADPQQPWDQGLKAEVERSITSLYKAANRPDALARWTEEQREERARAFEALMAEGDRATPKTLRAAGEMAFGHVDSGRKEEAVRLFERMLGRLRASGWPLDKDALDQYARLNLAVSTAGRHDLAAEASAEIVAKLREAPDTPPAVLARFLHLLGHHRLWGDRPADAEAPLRESLELYRRLAPDGWDATKTLFWLAISLELQKKLDDAEPLMLAADKETVARIAKAPAWEKHFPAFVANRLARVYHGLGKTAEAERWRAENARREEAQKSAQAK